MAFYIIIMQPFPGKDTGIPAAAKPFIYKQHNAPV